jgi:hypothetical protein
MRDPNKNVTFVFYCYEKESADLKIRLRYDGLKQSEFFRSILRMYTSKDPTLQPAIDKIKSTSTNTGKKKIRKSTKEMIQGQELLKSIDMTEEDKQHLFDIIQTGEEYE